MENGTYGNRNTNFIKYELKKFPASLFSFNEYCSLGCGPNALGLITGEDPAEIFKKHNNRTSYSDDLMINFLRKKGFSCFKVTKCNISNKKEINNYLINKLSPKNLLLTCQMIRKNEASWFVSWDNLTFHNFEIVRFNFSDMINNPVISCYVIYNPLWNN